MRLELGATVAEVQSPGIPGGEGVGSAGTKLWGPVPSKPSTTPRKGSYDSSMKARR